MNYVFSLETRGVTFSANTDLSSVIFVVSSATKVFRDGFSRAGLGRIQT